MVCSWVTWGAPKWVNLFVSARPPVRLRVRPLSSVQTPPICRSKLLEGHAPERTVARSLVLRSLGTQRPQLLEHLQPSCLDRALSPHAPRNPAPALGLEGHGGPGSRLCGLGQQRVPVPSPARKPRSRPRPGPQSAQPRGPGQQVSLLP